MCGGSYSNYYLYLNFMTTHSNQMISTSKRSPNHALFNDANLVRFGDVVVDEPCRRY